ncbi:MAG: hypothetical protein ABIL76_05280 [candidate division WOR-3 bacterium]
MKLEKILDNFQENFRNYLKERKISQIYKKIGEYIYEIYKSGEIIDDKNLLKLLKKIDEINKDEK